MPIMISSPVYFFLVHTLAIYFLPLSSLEIINILEKKCKTPLNVTTETGMTPLHLAVIAGRQQTVEYLVSQMGLSYLTQITKRPK